MAKTKASTDSIKQTFGKKKVVNTKENLGLKEKNQNLTEDKVVNCKYKRKNVNIYIEKHYEKNY